VFQDLLVPKVLKEIMVTLEFQVLLETLVLKDTLVPLVLLVMLVLQGILAKQVQRVILVNPENPDPMDQLALPEKKANLVQLEFLEILVLKATTV